MTTLDRLDQVLTELEALGQAAIKPPWIEAREEDGPDVAIKQGETTLAWMGDFYLEAKFIVALRNHWPFLLAKLRAARKMMEWVQHDIGCGYGPSRLRQPDGCDCGLAVALGVWQQAGEKK